ncbi:MAG: flippase-like domain-containing protein [Bacteroidia bacterium]
MPPKFNSLSKVFISLLWIAATVYGVYFIIDVLGRSFTGEFEWVFPGFSLGNMAMLIVLVILMLANWSIEALKWKLSVSDFEKQPFFQALKATLVGVSISTWMPNRLGEYLGKIFYLEQPNRYKGAISALFVSYTQIIATTFFGMLGAIYFLFEFKAGNNSWPYLIWLVLALGLLLFFLVFKKRILRLLMLKNKHVLTFLRTITRYGSKETLVLIGLSALRFCVFATQFVLALHLFGVNVPFVSTFLLVSLIYGIQTVVPTSAIAGLGIRGALSIYFIGLLTTSESAILMSTYFIWIINLLLPSVFGIVALLASPVKYEVKELALNWIKSKK